MLSQWQLPLFLPRSQVLLDLRSQEEVREEAATIYAEYASVSYADCCSAAAISSSSKRAASEAVAAAAACTAAASRHAVRTRLHVPLINRSRFIRALVRRLPLMKKLKFGILYAAGQVDTARARPR